MSGGSLAGLTVIDASRVLAGPYCGQLLGDHGARVIKIEGPDGDETRSFGPPVRDGSAAYFHALNRNKRGILLDLNTEAARDVFWRLLEDADVLIENFKPGTLRAWGIAEPAQICERFPHLVHCRITGFGDNGPLGGLPGYDAAIQAATGLMGINGEAGAAPLRLGVPVVDLATGMQAAIAVLAALQERQHSGRGQLCDVALYDCALGINHPHLPNYLWSGKEPARTGNGHPNVVPYNAFATATCPVYIAVGNDRQFALLCQALGCPDAAIDARFRHNTDRIANREALEALLREHLRGHDGHAIAGTLTRAGVPAAPVLGMAEVAGAAHTRHRDMVIERDGYRGTGFAAKLRRTPARLAHLPPRPGEHTGEILREAGFAPGTIAALTQAGAFGPQRLQEPTMSG